VTSFHEVNIQNTFRLPEYPRVDFGGHYMTHSGDRNCRRFNVNVQNASDRTSDLTGSTGEVRPASPIAMLRAVRWKLP